MSDEQKDAVQGWPPLKCECGHAKKWHRKRLGIHRHCEKRDCPCSAFVEKPLVEVEDA